MLKPKCHVVVVETDTVKPFHQSKLEAEVLPVNEVLNVSGWIVLDCDTG